MGSGQVEGEINRLKLLKQSIYGRAKSNLLPIRALHPNGEVCFPVARHLGEA